MDLNLLYFTLCQQYFSRIILASYPVFLHILASINTVLHSSPMETEMQGIIPTKNITPKLAVRANNFRSRSSMLCHHSKQEVLGHQQ